MHDNPFLAEHLELSRRYFLRLGMVGVVSGSLVSRSAAIGTTASAWNADKPEKAGVQRDPYFTLPAHFGDVSRGKPIPHTLSEEEKRNAGLTQETWKLEVLSDPDYPATLGKTFTKAEGTAIDFATLVQLGEKHAMRFPKVMTCLNMGCPLGMGLWEGVPLRELVWMTQPSENLRRVFYYGFHNNDPQQIFRSSLPIGRVLEDPFDLPPVILCYKLNGEWLDPQRGGPVRMLVPECYGFKSVKWLSHVVLTNLPHANDTYAEQNNDIDSPLKTFSATLSIPDVIRANEPIAVSGYAQVGIGGLSKVQVAIEPIETSRRASDPYALQAPWSNAEILPPPENWASLKDGVIPPNTHGFDASGHPLAWPLRLTNAHWAAKLSGLPAGEYVLRSRTIDSHDNAQPMPRPFRKSGHTSIESLTITVVS